jgi:hypothetical protein
MESPKLSKNPAFWAALSIIIVTIALALANYSGLLEFHILVGPFFIHHWMSWSGSLFIAIATPLYSYLKSRSPEKRNRLSNVHMFGNLGAFLLISIHFSQQMSRPTEFFPDPGNDRCSAKVPDFRETGEILPPATHRRHHDLLHHYCHSHTARPGNHMIIRPIPRANYHVLP